MPSINPIMSDIGEPPPKKRRFFESASPSPPPAPPPAELAKAAHGLEATDKPEATRTTGSASTDTDADAASGFGFDVDLLTSIIGTELDAEDVRRLRQDSGGDLQRAVNLYFDGSWKSKTAQASGLALPGVRSSVGKGQSQRTLAFAQRGKERGSDVFVDTLPLASSDKSEKIPRRRYVGSMGVTGWATRSGRGLMSFGEKVRIERTTPQKSNFFRTGKSRMPPAARRQDTVVRLKNARDEEVGRLESESSLWISTLMDQGICGMEGFCVFAPDPIRTNDTIDLQVNCYVLSTAFGPYERPGPVENELQQLEREESEQEARLRKRQVAIVRLLERLNLKPIGTSQDEAEKRNNLLQAAESAEDSGKTTPSGATGEQSPNEEAEEGKELEEDQLDTLYKKAQSFDFNTPQAEPAETFALTLRNYQKQALYWMTQKEKDTKRDDAPRSMHPLWDEYAWPTTDVDGNELPLLPDQKAFYVNPFAGEISLDFPVQEENYLGGILADEMGLGKTIEVMSLIHSHQPQFSPSSLRSSTGEQQTDKVQSGFGSAKWAPTTTLIVAPMSLLSQWEKEAERSSISNSVNIMTYYGADKRADLQTFCSDGASSCPNIIITSYGVVLSEFLSNVGNSRPRGLYSLHYLRVILDEAHSIKNRKSKTAKACYNLQAQCRWVVTGTPIINRLEDLFSLVHFLKLEPWGTFSYWKTFITTPFESKDFVRALSVVQTVLEPLVLRRTKDMKTPSGEALVPLPPRTIDIEKVSLSTTERELYDHILARAKRTFDSNIEAGTLMKSYTTILAQILRLRQSCCHPSLIRRKVPPTGDATSNGDPDSAAAAGDAFPDDIDLDTLLAQFSAESDLATDARKFGAHVLSQIRAEASDECPICAEERMNPRAVTGCWHSACRGCLITYVEHHRRRGEVPRCWNCRMEIDPREIFEVKEVPKGEDESFDSGFGDINGEITSSSQSGSTKLVLQRLHHGSSSKVAALINHLVQLRTDAPRLKSVIFSQFTSFLDVIEPALARERIPFVRVDGSVAQKKRAAILDDFRSRRGTVVLLLTLRAGGVGLNLTSANRVFLMDPWWSWAVEAQAIDRVHRLGQEGEVAVTRFVVEGSVEERMLKVQERKKFLASSLGMMSDEEKKLQRIEDIKELLS